MYRLFAPPEYDKSLSKLPKSEIGRIISKLEKTVYPLLKQEPHYGSQIKKIRDYSPETWRFRIGNFRLFYGIDEKEKTVILYAIDDRKDAY